MLNKDMDCLLNETARLLVIRDKFNEVDCTALLRE